MGSDAAVELVVRDAEEQAEAMDAYGQFCPVALGAEIFAEKWTPLILRELLLGSHRFSELRKGLPRISRNLLVQRLASLEAAGLVERRLRANGRGYDYSLTPAGEELRPVIVALGAWGYKWAAQELRAENLDAGLLMWFLRRRVVTSQLPAERTVVRFDFRESGTRSFWLEEQQSFWFVIERPEVELCLTDPGSEVDLIVRADVAALTRVYLGHMSLAKGLRSGLIELSGAHEVSSGFRRWLGISPFAEQSHALRRPVAAAS
jgi:DNA-binding HxlR family transcriptional regulator